MSAVWGWNPYTGMPRWPEDIASDPQGLLIVPLGGALQAAHSPDSVRAPQEVTPEMLAAFKAAFSEGSIWEDRVTAGAKAMFAVSGLLVTGALPAPTKTPSIADHLFIEMRGDGIWLVCVEKVHTSRDAAQKACREWQSRTRVVSDEVGDPTFTKSQIQTMVDRFLGWPLPKTFAPDCGISFKPLAYPNSWPVGTNLFTAIEARAMFAYALEASTSVRLVTGALPASLCQGRNCTATDGKSHSPECHEDHNRTVMQGLRAEDNPNYRRTAANAHTQWEQDRLRANSTGEPK